MRKLRVSPVMVFAATVLALLVGLVTLLGSGGPQPASAQPVSGTLLVTFEAQPPLDPTFMLGLCVEIRDGFDQALKAKVCDGGIGDDDGSLNGAIQTLLLVNNPFLILKGRYAPVAQTTLEPDQFELDGPAKRSCAFLESLECDITFSYISLKPPPTPTPRRAAVGGILVAPDQGELPPAAADSSGTGSGLLTGLVVGATAGVIALGGAGWYARRRWQRGDELRLEARDEQR